jgi:Glycosyl transferase family 2
LCLLVISFCGRSVELRHPPDWERDLRILFGVCAPSSAKVCATLKLALADDGSFAIFEDDVPTIKGLSREDALLWLSEIVIRQLAEHVDTGVSLHSGVVGWNGRSVLIPGNSGAGKSSLTAWFVHKGFDYVTDELAVLNNGAAIVGFPRSFMLKSGADSIVSQFPRFADIVKLQVGSALMIRPEDSAGALSGDLPCGLIIFPAFKPDVSFTIESISPAKACIRLAACTGNTHSLVDGGFAALNSLARRVPAVELSYGAFAQLDDVVDILAKLMLEGDLDGRRARRFLAAFAGPQARSKAAPLKRYQIPAPTPRRGAPKLTIGMATYDDYDGVYFSLQALRLYHPEIVDETEFIVVDNHPDGPCAEALKALERHLPNYRYVPESVHSGTAVRGRVFEEAAGEFVLCMDCHVFVVPGAVARLLCYFSENQTTLDLLQGPLLGDDLESLSTHFRPEWSGGMYGVWDNNGLAADPDAPPFEIPMQGMGLFACRHAAWLGFNKAFRGFGGEEGYIHEKFRQAGARTLCLPFLRWIHRFNRPMGLTYRNNLEDRIWNYLVGFGELDLPTTEMEEHFRGLIGEPNGSKIIAFLKQKIGQHHRRH